MNIEAELQLNEMYKKKSLMLDQIKEIIDKYNQEHTTRGIRFTTPEISKIEKILKELENE